MKIVIAGAGKVGFTVAQRLCREGHDITLIDTRRELLESASNAMDVMGVCGSCASYSGSRRKRYSRQRELASATTD